MSVMPRISVCIANYNGEAMIAGCIDSVLAQHGNFALEIVVHDDASSDASAIIISRDYPTIHLLRSADNVGFCVANNRMAAAACGDYVLLLNNDAMLLPDALATLLAEAERLNRTAILTLPQYDAESGALLDIGCRLDPFLNPVPNRDPMSIDVGMVMGACLWIDRALWEELGGFPDWFGSIGEDLYLCCRARLGGHPVRALGRSGYRHRVGRSFGGGKVAEGRLVSTFRRRALSERNKTFVIAICYPTYFMQLILPLHLVLLLLEGIALSLLKLDSRYLREIYLPVFDSLVLHWREWHAARSATQKKRRVAGTDFFSVFDWVPYKWRMLVRHGLPAVR